MSIFKEKKQFVFGILVDIFICILAFIIFFSYLSNETVEVSSFSNTSSFNNVVSNILIAELENISSDTEEVTEIVTDEKASDKELEEEKVTKKDEKKTTSPYYIKVNYSANVVTVYKKDKNDKYTVPYKAMVCSCGTYTPTGGTYKTTSKYRWGKLIHDVYGQYATRIVGSILFHSVPYSSNKADTLIFNEYDKLGTTASAGCVRLTVKDAKWIYDNCPKGTMVEFYSDSAPGPLGKPSAQKISSVEQCRNWDPTDPATENPWNTYKPEEEKPSIDISNNTVTNTIVNGNEINSVISNNTVNNSTTSTNSIANSVISNNAITGTNTTVYNNVINNNIVNNAIQNNNSITENTTALNNSVNTSNNVTNSNNTINYINNIIINNIV